MRGKDKTQRTKKTSFANIVILLCVAVGLFVTLSVVYEYHRLDTVIPAGVISALFALWGGELLIVALRQIFGSDVIKTRGQTETKNDSDIFGGSI